MDRKKLVLLLGALVVAIGTALAARSMFAGASTPQTQAAPVPQGPKVLVAKRALPLGTIITADAVGYQLWPKEMVQDAYFVDGEADMSKLLGTVVRYPITAGEPVTQGALVSPGDRGFLAAALGPGMRAVTIPVSEKTGVGGFVFPGDHIDLMLTQTINGESGQNLNTTETILRNLRVLATDQKTETSTDENGKSVAKVVRTVTLEATPKIAEKISVAQTIGTLSLSLRSLADSQSDLDRAIAEGTVKVPDGLSKDAEDKLLTRASKDSQDGPSSFVTGGDVSRFQRSTVPPRTSPSAPVADAAPGAARAATPAHVGPVVRVFRGEAVSEQPVGGSARGMAGSARGMVDQQARGVRGAAGTVPAASAASLIAG
jgi:pilus assembly protein CpaB